MSTTVADGWPPSGCILRCILTTKHLVEEPIAHRKDPAAVGKGGCHHVIRYERESVREIEHALGQMLAPCIERLTEGAGDLDLGPLASGCTPPAASARTLPEAGDEDLEDAPGPRT